MPGIVLSANPIGTTSRPAHFEYYNHYDEVDLGFGKKKRVRTRMQRHVPACEAVIFICPASRCGKRNEQSILRAKASIGETLSFTCAKCGREIEVSKPKPKLQAIVVPGIEKAKPFGLVDPSGRPIHS
jgi:predicted RNA-binding Zn-ribbon protein involved in translation (DUF1610 family)